MRGRHIPKGGHDGQSSVLGTLRVYRTLVDAGSASQSFVSSWMGHTNLPTFSERSQAVIQTD